MRSIRSAGLVIPLLLATAAPAAVDVAGRWSHRNGSGVTIEQVGDTVTMPGLWSPVRGTMTAAGSFVTLTPIGGIPQCTEYVDLRLVPGAQVLHGTRAYGCAGNPPLWQFDQFVLTRCGCDDGNSIDGDGCDAHCQIEPCFTCTGTPSVCTPSADAAPCDDHASCTAGETCQAGVCSGAAIPGCFDLAGPWRVRFEESYTETVIEEDVVAEQRDNVVILPTEFGGPWVGIVDSVSGAFQLDLAPSARCGSGRVMGTAIASSFATTGVYSVAAAMDCSYLDILFSGTRLCVDGTACDDGDACTTGDTCVDSLCQPGAPLECGACLSCDAALGCVAAPREDCRTAGKSVLQLSDAADASGDAITWRWLKGAATTLTDLGDPTDTNDAALCLFDESAAAPTLLFRATAPLGTAWRPTSRGYVYRDPARGGDGLGGITMVGGSAGQSKILVRGKGGSLSGRAWGLPPPPLDPPLRVQLQLDGAACFESAFDAASVRRNRPGAFKALGVP